MNLYFIKHNKQLKTVIVLKQTGNKIHVIKTYDKGRLLLNNQAAKQLKRLSPIIGKIPYEKLLSTLRKIIHNFNEVYRTYDMDKIQIIQTIQL